MSVRKLLLSSVAAASVALGAAPVLAQNATQPQAQAQGFQPDARSQLSPGLHDAGQQGRGMALEHNVPPPPGFFDPDALFAVPQTREEQEAFAARMRENPPRYSPLALANTDLALSGDRLIMGNFHGFNIYQLKDEAAPALILSVVCPGGQGDVSIHGDLLFMSVEQNRARLDCGAADAEGEVNPERFRGVRIFDISDISAPRQIAAVQTCRGSHTHTLVPHPTDANVLYIYNSGTAGVRRTDELGICSDGQPEQNADTALYSIDVIRVPLDAPHEAAIVNRPRIFADRDTGEIAGLWRGGAAGVAAQRTAQTNHCHDITVYPELNLAAGACSGNGILLDISDPENPARISDLFDADMAYWHSATFTNDGQRVLFTDEWGGGIAARCRGVDPVNWGANLIADVDDGELKGRSFFKIPTAQAPSENCVAHNGSLIPVPGRDIMVQAWYQGGVSVVDFTDPAQPIEIAWFDRGPIDARSLVVGGHWSAYWMNGRIYASEIARGLDVLQLTPSEHLSAAEIAAAEAVRETVINPQTQTRIVWEDTPVVARAYLDQLTRAEAVDAALAARVQAGIDHWSQGRPDAAGLGELSRELEAAAEKAPRTAAPRLRALSALLGRAAA